jgi:type VI secretion system secreted protein VgrG
MIPYYPLIDPAPAVVRLQGWRVRLRLQGRQCMSITTQDHRVFELKTPLGKDVLLLQKMIGTEPMSQPFVLELDLLSEKGDIKADDILGQKVCVSLTLPQGQKRFFHGFVSEFSHGGWQRYYHYRAIVRPWYWLLTRTADCRIFQELTVPQIFEHVVQQYGFTDYELRLTGNYQVREYCVQYRETDFNFLSRLLEQEGIYFFFEHAETKHTLVLIDDPGKHQTCSGYETVPYYPPAGKDMLRERDHLQTWTCTSSVRSGSFATTDFDFEQPRKSLAGSASIARQHQQSNYEVFDYPGLLTPLESQQSDQVAKVRIQELQSPYMVASGHGNAAGLGTGVRFTLDKFPRKDLNIAYIVTRANYTITANTYETGQSQTTQEFTVAIEAIDARTQFRPERRTSKALIHGTQTAIVVGPAGEEIYTDKYGRVKVQFHWDRYGKQDEQSSCWVRVSQPWAGKNWGAIHIPRIGQEVIVSFLEGDPDRPIITGRVYNGDSMPPYTLPGNATQSGIKTRSSKGGSDANFNEIRFEDLKGSEQLYVHAEKNHDIVVEKDETHSVGNDRSKTITHDETTKVGHDRTETVGNNEQISVGVNRSEQVGANENIKIGANRTEAVGANETISIVSNRTKSVGGNETATVSMLRFHNVGINEMVNVGGAQEVNIGAAQTITVGAAQLITVGAAQVTSVGVNQSTNVAVHRSVTVGGSQSHHVVGERKAKVDAADKLHVGTSIQIEAGESVIIKTGKASIMMKSDGTIQINGQDITTKGSGTVHVKAAGDVEIKGKSVKHNC